MNVYAVIGDPVSHSKSPLIHSLFAKQTGQSISYVAQKVVTEKFDEFVAKFFKEGGSGLNVTLPHKERAYKLAKSCDSGSKKAEAANTLFQNSAGEICAANTDGRGLVVDLKSNNGTEIKGKDLLLLGAGGAIRGALVSLVEEKPSSITIVNRTIAKADDLKIKFKNFARIETSTYKGLKGDYDLIINGTSLGLTDGTPPLRDINVRQGAFCYDMFYSDEQTAFVRWAMANGAGKAIDGLGMLVEQAAESFLLWRGIRPETRKIIDELKGV